MGTIGTKKKIDYKISLKSLSKTPSGKIYHNDLKNIFSVLLFCLDLKDEVKKPPSNLIKFSFKKQHPYSFTLEKAIDTMANLHINLQYNSTLNKLSYEINSKFAFELLQLFYRAKLLHCPDDKTCKIISNNKKNLLLQPTPKGVAILHQFCIKKGIPNIQNILLPKILNSNFNSMKLMEFERHSRTDSIIHSENSDKLLFIQIMGPKINIWSPKNGPVPISLQGKELSELHSDSKNHIYGTKEHETANNPLKNESTFFEYLKQRQNDQIHPFSCNDQNLIPLKSKSNLENESPQKETYSPFYHRFFTNPDSDSHIQYYESNESLRFFIKKQILINDKEKIIKNCFSGKSLIQFLMDRTDIMYPKEALKVATIFLQLKLIKCETLSSDQQQRDIFTESKKCLYSLTNTGYQLVKWNFGINSNTTIEQAHPNNKELRINTLTLDLTLKDPGLKYLFRKFMLNKMCAENLEVYDKIVDFQKKIKILMKMLSLKDREKKKYFTDLKNVDLSKDPDFIYLQTNFFKHKKLTIYTAINKISEYCLSEAYDIFTMYISDDAPNEINVDSKLRLSVRSLIEKKDELDSPCLEISELKNKINLYIANNYNKDNIKENNSEKSELCNEKEKDKYNKESIILTEENNNDLNQDKVETSKNLTLKLKNLRDLNNPPLISPTDAVFGPKLSFLKELAVLYEKIRQKVYRMMETDSFSKFLESSELKENYCVF